MLDEAHPLPTATLDAPDRTVRLGFVALTDAAPLLVARALGLFARHGVAVSLAAAGSWSALRDRIAFGALDGAALLSPMPIAAALGLGGVRAALVVTATLGRVGNSVALSAPVMDAIAADGQPPFPLPAAHLAAHIARRTTPLTLAVVFGFSSHHYLLRAWLADGGLDPDRDLRLVVLPPADMPAALADGTIDGFCAGEPWGSQAVALGTGRIALTTGAIWPDHPEKVLAFSASLAAHAPDRLRAATAAIIAAGHWLDDPAHRAEAVAILRRDGFGGGVSEAVLRRALDGRLVARLGGPDLDIAPLRFAANNSTRPDPADQAAWLAHMRRWGHAAPDADPGPIWRDDLWLSSTAKDLA